MMLSIYKNLDNQMLEFDLDTVIDVVNGWSDIKLGWQGFVVYLPDKDQFIELMSSVPDIRGDSEERAAEVEAEYVKATYGLSVTQIIELRRAPSQWKFIKNR